MSRSFAGAAGNRLVATEMGPPGAPVLLLHGGGQTRHAWSHSARRLAETGWHAVALDQRGHGDSAWVPDGAYSFRDFADDAIAVAAQLTREHGRRPVAVGASLGGIASLHALGRAGPPCFAGLVLVDIVPKMDPAGVSHIQNFMRARAAEGFASIDEAAEAVAQYLPHRPRPPSNEGLRKNLREHPDGRWRWHWDPRFLDGPRATGVERSEVERELLDAARSLSIATLLVRGASSELVTQAAVDQFLALVPGAEFREVAGARHMVAGDRNDVFADAILDFLARLPPTTGVERAELLT
jgi:pimeloyl-ACP methyl ester carboxylesterase